MCRICAIFIKSTTFILPFTKNVLQQVCKRSDRELLNFICIELFSYSYYAAATAAGDGWPLGTGKPAVFPERETGLKRNIGTFLFQKSSEISAVIQRTTARTWNFSVYNSFKSVAVRNTRRYTQCALRIYTMNNVCESKTI